MKTVIVIVNTDRNFTPRDLMAIAARQHSNMTFSPGIWNALLIIDGRPYQYHHWQICDGYVALTLEEVPTNGLS